MRRTVVIVAIAALTLTGCSKKPVDEGALLFVCDAYTLAYEKGFPELARSSAQQGLVEDYHMSPADAADAIDTARREYCP